MTLAGGMSSQSGYAGQSPAGSAAPIENYFDVTPGAATLLSLSTIQSPLAAEIVNQDSVNAIWISTSPAVQPGSGRFIGPNGSTTWSNAAQPPYAVVDTGVTTSVRVQVTSNVGGTQNPQLVAEATAQAIIAQGVVVDLFSPPNQPPLPNTIPVFQRFPATGFQSVFINLACNPFPASTNVLVVVVQFFDKAGFLVGSETLTAFSDASVSAPSIGAGAAWVMPCNADHFTVTPVSASTAGYLYVGASARPCPSPGLSMYGGNRGGPTKLLNKSALVAGVAQFLVNPGTGESSTDYNGIIDLTVFNSTAGLLSVTWADGSELVRDSFAILRCPVTAPVGPLTLQFVHPPVPCAWVFIPDVSAAANSVSLLVSGVSG